MKEGWTYKKLGEVCRINSGKSIKAELIHSERLNNEVPCYGGNGLRGYVSSPNSLGGNPIIGRVGAQCGNVHYSEEPFYATEHALVVTILSKDVNPLWLCYLFETMNLKQYAEGAAQPVIAGGKLKNLDFILPPLNEQQQIVSRLDAAFAHIDELKANAEKQLSEARVLFQKALTKAMEPKVGWGAKKIKDISLLITKGSSPKWQGNSYVNSGGILFVTSENVREGYLEFNPAKYVDNSFNIKQRRSILKKNDVLVNIVGASIGRAAVFDIDVENANINQAVCLIRLDKNKLLPKYLCLFLNSEHAFNQYASMIKDTARANLSLDNIGCLEIGVPSLSEQQRIVSRLDAISAHIRELEDVLQKTIAECDALKQALLRKVFE